DPHLAFETGIPNRGFFGVVWFAGLALGFRSRIQGADPWRAHRSSFLRAQPRGRKRRVLWHGAALTSSKVSRPAKPWRTVTPSPFLSSQERVLSEAAGTSGMAVAA